MRKIPIDEAERLAGEYGYNQIVILALKRSEKSNWFYGWTTTFNQNKTKCKFLGRVASILANNFRAFYSNEKMTEEYHQKMLDNERDLLKKNT